MDYKKLMQQIENEEGNVPYAYQDHLGYWTIGIGFLIDQRKGGGLHPEEIQFIFTRRIKETIADLRKFSWYDSLNEAQQAALISMHYNLGSTKFRGFKEMIRNFEQGNIKGAVAEMLDSKWAKQDVPKRAKALAKQVETGLW